MAEEKNDESTVPVSTDQQQEQKPSPAKPTLGIYLLVFGVGGLGYLAGYLLQSRIADPVPFDPYHAGLPFAGMWLAWSCLLALRFSGRHGIVPGAVWGLAMVGFPVLTVAGLELGLFFLDSEPPGASFLPVFPGLVGAGLGAWLIYKTAKWLDAKKKVATAEPPAGDEESDSEAL